jgi:hypothetical protein
MAAVAYSSLLRSAKRMVTKLETVPTPLQLKEFFANKRKKVKIDMEVARRIQKDLIAANERLPKPLPKAEVSGGTSPSSDEATTTSPRAQQALKRGGNWGR